MTERKRMQITKAILRQHPDAVVWIRLDNVYIASNPPAMFQPLASVEEIDKVIAQLVSNGFRCAVCESA